MPTFSKRSIPFWQPAYSPLPRPITALADGRSGTTSRCCAGIGSKSMPAAVCEDKNGVNKRTPTGYPERHCVRWRWRGIVDPDRSCTKSKVRGSDAPV